MKMAAVAVLLAAEDELRSLIEDSGDEILGVSRPLSIITIEGVRAINPQFVPMGVVRRSYNGIMTLVGLKIRVSVVRLIRIGSSRSSPSGYSSRA